MPQQQQNNKTQKTNNKKRKNNKSRAFNKVQNQLAVTSEGRRLAYGSMSRAIGTRMGENLTRLMATPRESELVRMPTPDMPLCAVLRSDSIFSVVNTAQTPSGFESGTVIYMLFGQPARGLIYGPVIDSSYQYKCVPASGWADTYFPIKASNNVAIMGESQISSAAIKSCNRFSGVSAHGPKRPIGSKSSHTFLWMDEGESISTQVFVSGDMVSWTAMSNASIATFYLRLYRTDSGPEPEVWIATNSWNGVGASGHTITTAGYYRVDIQVIFAGSTSNYYAHDMYINNTNPNHQSYPIRPLPQITNVPDCARKCRRTACSLLITNTSAEMYTQGNVIAARLDCDYVHKTDRERLELAADKYSGKAKNGCYTYMDFSQGAEKFVDCVDLNSSFNVDSLVYDLTWSEMVHYIAITSPNPTTQSNNFVVTMDCVVEFMTDKPSYSRAVSTLSFDQLIEARRINNSTPYFYENPLHLSDITRRINQVWMTMRKYATPIGMGLSAAFPQAAPAIMPVARYFQR